MCEEFEKGQDLGQLQGRWAQHLTFLRLIKPTEQSYENEGLHGKNDTKGNFRFFNEALQNFLSHPVRPTFSPRTKPAAFGIA